MSLHSGKIDFYLSKGKQTKCFLVVYLTKMIFFFNNNKAKVLGLFSQF